MIYTNKLDNNAAFFIPIEVTLKLKKSQCLGFNQWKCKINNEERIVPNRIVKFYTENLNTALNAFDEKEIEGFVMNKNYEVNYSNYFRNEW
jgi:hypothetical protein